MHRSQAGFLLAIGTLSASTNQKPWQLDTSLWNCTLMETWTHCKQDKRKKKKEILERHQTWHREESNEHVHPCSIRYRNDALIVYGQKGVEPDQMKKCFTRCAEEREANASGEQGGGISGSNKYSPCLFGANRSEIERLKTKWWGSSGGSCTISCINCVRACVSNQIFSRHIHWSLISLSVTVVTTHKLLHAKNFCLG